MVVVRFPPAAAALLLYNVITEELVVIESETKKNKTTQGACKILRDSEGCALIRQQNSNNKKPLCMTTRISLNTVQMLSLPCSWLAY